MLPAATALVPLSFLGDFGETLGEIGFVIRLMAFVYILFWLYATFQDNQLLFGFTALIAAYFVIFYASILVILAIVVLLMVNGMFLQQSIMFGLFPALGRSQMGTPMDYAHEEEKIMADNMQNRLQAGHQLSQDEMQFLARMQQGQAVAQAQIQQFTGGDDGPAMGPGYIAPPSPSMFSQIGMRRGR